MARFQRKVIDPAQLRELWPAMSAWKIARTIGTDVVHVKRLAAELGLEERARFAEVRTSIERTDYGTEGDVAARSTATGATSFRGPMPVRIRCQQCHGIAAVTWAEARTAACGLSTILCPRFHPVSIVALPAARPA